MPVIFARSSAHISSHRQEHVEVPDGSFQKPIARRFSEVHSYRPSSCSSPRIESGLGLGVLDPGFCLDCKELVPRIINANR
jgi:hypothetical protein